MFKNYALFFGILKSIYSSFKKKISVTGGSRKEWF